MRLKITLIIALIILYIWCINKFNLSTGTILFTLLIISSLAVEIIRYNNK